MWRGEAVGGESEAGANNFMVVVNGKMDGEYRGRVILDGMERAKVQFQTW